jgi:hypothetical protein
MSVIMPSPHFGHLELISVMLNLLEDLTSLSQVYDQEKRLGERRGYPEVRKDSEAVFARNKRLGVGGVRRYPDSNAGASSES